MVARCWLLIVLTFAALNTGCCVNRFGCGCDGLNMNCGECGGCDDCYQTSGYAGGACGGCGTMGCGGDCGYSGGYDVGYSSGSSCGGCGGGCGGVGCGGCGDCCTTPYRYGCGCLGNGCLIRAVLAPFACIGRCIVCPGGCGEVYVDEWLSDPPDCCDPCGPCGEWTGSGCCTPRRCRLYTPHGFGWRPIPRRGCEAGCGGNCGGGCGCDGGGYGAGYGYAEGPYLEGPHGHGGHCSTCNQGGPTSVLAAQPGETVIIDDPHQALHGKPTRSALRSSTVISPQSYQPSSSVIWPGEKPVRRQRTSGRAGSNFDR